ENLARAVTRSNTLGISRKRRQILVPAIWKLAMLHPVDLVSKFGESLRVGVEQFFPSVAKLAAAFPDSLLKVFADSVRYQKLGILRPAIEFLYQPHFLFPKRLAMSFIRILFVRRAVADMAIHNDQRGPVFGLQKIDAGIRKRVEIVSVVYASDVPAIPEKPFTDVFCERNVSRTIERHTIVVVDPAQIGQLQMSRERCRLGTHPLHHVAIAAHGIDVVIENLKAGTVVVRCQPVRSNCHSHAIGDTLAERTGCGFDARSNSIFRMSRSTTVDLPEPFNIV